MKELSLDYLKSILHYDNESGVFTRIKTTSSRAISGRTPGSVSGGYLRININRKIYYAHRLAWFYFYGVWPEEEIDHINRNKLDNRISNLRAVSKAQNNQNLPISKANKSGFVGVSWNKDRKRWVAQISINGNVKRIGRFKEFEDAKNAYIDFKRKSHPYSTI